MVPGIEPSTTALLAQRSTDWAIRPSYLLMHNLLQILISRENRKYWRSKRHMLFASWHFLLWFLLLVLHFLSYSFHSFLFLFLFVWLSPCRLSLPFLCLHNNLLVPYWLVQSEFLLILSEMKIPFDLFKFKIQKSLFKVDVEFMITLICTIF